MMIRIRNKNHEIEVGSKNELFCSFDIYWRNLKGECHCDDRCIDIMVKEIILKPSNKRVKVLNRSCTPVTLKSFHAFLNGSGIQWNPGNGIFYRDDENDDIPIDSDWEYEEALKFLISHNEKTKKNVMLIIEGDICKTDHGLVNMMSMQSKVPVILSDTLTSSTVGIVTFDSLHQTSENNLNYSKRRKTKSSTPMINVASDSSQDEAFEWFQNYMDSYKKEIVDDVVNIMEKKLLTAFGSLRNDNVNPVHEKSTASSRHMNDRAKFQEYFQSLHESIENNSLPPFHILSKQRELHIPQPSTTVVKPVHPVILKPNAMLPYASSNFSTHHCIQERSPKHIPAKSNNNPKNSNKKKIKVQKDLFIMNNQEICGDRDIRIVKSGGNVLRSTKPNPMVGVNRKSKVSKVKNERKKTVKKINGDDDVNGIINKPVKLAVQDDTSIDLAVISEEAGKVSNHINEEKNRSLDIISLHTSSDTDEDYSSVERKHSSIQVYDCLSDEESEYQMNNEGVQDPILIVESSNISDQQNMEETILPELNKRSGGAYSFVSSALLHASSNETTLTETLGQNNNNGKMLSENKEYCDCPPTQKEQTTGNQQTLNDTNHSRSAKLTRTSPNATENAKSSSKHRNSRYLDEYFNINDYQRSNNIHHVSNFNHNFMDSTVAGALGAASEAYSLAREVIEKINISSRVKK